MWRYLGACKFNVEYFNKDYYSKFYLKPHSGNFIQCEYETNKDTENFILSDVINFYLSTDLYSQTGLSLSEAMQLDFATWNLLKTKYKEMDGPRRAALNNIQDSISAGSKKNLQSDMEKRIAHERKSGPKRR